MRKLELALVLVGVLAGCGQPQTQPPPPPPPQTPPPPQPPVAPTTRDVPVTIKNDTTDTRIIAVDIYHSEKGHMTPAPDSETELGSLGPGESMTKTLTVPVGGYYRILGMRPMEGEKPKLSFMGSFTKLKDSGDEAPVSVNR
jgi:hypothetical protein